MATGFTRSLSRRVDNGAVQETVFTIDVTLSESHTSEAEITQHPIESGSRIADHIVLQNKTVEISGFIGREAACGTADAFGQSGGSRMREAYARLEEIQARGELLSIQTGLKFYDNLLISSVSSAQDDNTQDLLWFTFSAEQVRIIGLEEIVGATQERGHIAGQNVSTAEATESLGGNNNQLIAGGG